jgi:hypothetical protein
MLKQIPFLLILKLSQMGSLKMLIICLSSSSFIAKSSDKLRRISLQNGFSFSEKKSFLSMVSYLSHIFLFNLEITFSNGTYSWDKEVYEAKAY